METCRIYIFDKDYGHEKNDVENEINSMLDDGWKAKCVSSVIGGTTQDEVVVTVIYEKPEETKKDID